MNNQEILTSRIEQSKQTVTEDIDGEVVVLTLHDNIPHVLNKSASRIWQLIADQKLASEVVDNVCAETKADGARVKDDVLRLFKDFQARRMISIHK